MVRGGIAGQRPTVSGKFDGSLGSGR